MMWWDKKDERFNEWHSYDNSAQENPIKNFEIEPCLTTCPSCGEELFVAVRFEFNKPVRITKVGKEQDLVWEEYYPAKE